LGEMQSASSFRTAAQFNYIGWQDACFDFAVHSG
jgi:hypothetical protein